MPTDEELIQHLKEFANKLGKVPTQREMKSDGPYSATTYQKHFGCWNDALKEAD